jgi:hypothetical protein
VDLSRSLRKDFFSRTDLRLICFGLVAISAVYLGFIGVSVVHAEAFIKYAAYYLLLFTFVLWCGSLWRLWQSRLSNQFNWSGRERALVCLMILTFTGVAAAHETFRSKILNDEFVLQSTAFNMHFFREAVAMARGYDILGTFFSTDTFLDKRPNFYPFLVSLVHDFTGYRLANAFYLNTALMALTLGLAYYVGRRLSGWRGGVLAVALLGSLPIFAQNSTGSGMEMINLTMLLSVVALAAIYIESPDEVSLSPFLLATVLLAQCRYESVLYVLPAALLVLMGWWKTRRITLSWVGVVTPWLLVTVALHNKVLSHSPTLWEMKQNQTSRFGVEYVAGNFKGAVDFLFSLNQRQANSLVLSTIGIAGMVWALIVLVVRRKRLGQLEPLALSWIFFGAGVIANTILVFFYFWSSFMDPMASRFCMPLYLLLVFASIFFAQWLDRRLPATTIFLFVTGVCFLGFSIPKQSAHIYSRVGIDEIEWERRYVAARGPGERIILANNSTIIWLLEKIPSILLNRARLVADRLRYQLGESHFQEILVLQSLRPTTSEGDHEIVPEDRLPEGYHLKILTEKRFGTKIIRISRLMSVEADHPVTP